MAGEESNDYSATAPAFDNEIAEDNATYDGRSHQTDLVAWQKAIDLSVTIYKITKTWPREEIYGLTSQIRRAAVSIAANIAEGQGRNGDREFLHHLSIAHGSLREVETLCLVAQRIGYIGEDEKQKLIGHCSDVGRPMRGLIKHLRDRL